MTATGVHWWPAWKRIVRMATIVVLALACAACRAAPAGDDWPAFRDRFIDGSGRVVDTANGGISHSEGQGFAMLLAVHHGDRAGFDRLWQWTRSRLQVRDDGLFAWRWEDGKGVTDRNNASDGDLLIAWALLRAGSRWQDPALTEAGRRIAAALRTGAVRRATHGTVLLPGRDGFDKPDGIVVNLSYWVFPALADIERADPAPEWADLRRTGLEMLGYARFGRWALPPDWLRLSDPVRPADGFAPRFGYDAVRIPLYLWWAGLASDRLLQPYRDYWSVFDKAPFLPSWTNLQDDGVDSRDAGAGIRAVAALARDGAGAALPPLDAREPYYQAALLLLCKMAVAERGGR